MSYMGRPQPHTVNTNTKPTFSESGITLPTTALPPPSAPSKVWENKQGYLTHIKGAKARQTITTSQLVAATKEEYEELARAVRAKSHAHSRSRSARLAASNECESAVERASERASERNGSICVPPRCRSIALALPRRLPPPSPPSAAT